ncbi:MAG: caspase family protein [Bryobacteraceae bacterium]|jgi:Caspase domain
MNLCRRWARCLLTGAVAAALACAPLAGQEGCAVSKDLVVRALELVSAAPARDDLSNGILLLKQAAEACDENGDAWYYRSLFERKLGQGNPQYALGKARERHSAGLKSEDDPFHLATPMTRGVHIVPQGGPEARPAGPSQKWALVVGIATFSDARLNLKFTDKDATSMAALLKDPGYGKFAPDHVKLIADAEATTVNVRAGLNWLARQAAENDLAVIYIATHGTSRDQDTAGTNYMVTFDTDVKSQDGLYSTAIPLVEVSNVVRTRLRALKAVVILDTCHSQGALSQTVAVPASISPQMVDRIREGTGRVVMGASQVEESSYESPKYGHGLFTYYLLQGMKERKDAPIDKIFEYVKAHVEQDAAANGWKQHPFFSVSDAAAPLVLGF